MRLGWAFFGLIVVALIGYWLNRGLYVGWSVDEDPSGNKGRQWYIMHCHYLFPTGIERSYGGSGYSPDAAWGNCRLFCDAHIYAAVGCVLIASPCNC